MYYDCITELATRGCDDRLQSILTAITNIDKDKSKLVKLKLWLQDIRIF
jgi:hypothetical protein